MCQLFVYLIVVKPHCMSRQNTFIFLFSADLCAAWWSLFLSLPPCSQHYERWSKVIKSTLLWTFPLQTASTFMEPWWPTAPLTVRWMAEQQNRTVCVIENRQHNCVSVQNRSLLSIFFFRQHPLCTVFSSKLCSRVPSGFFSADYQPEHLQQLLILHTWRLLLSEWHPCSQPAVDHMWPFCTVSCH